MLARTSSVICTLLILAAGIAWIPTARAESEPPPGPVMCALDRTVQNGKAPLPNQIVLTCNLLGGAELQDRITIIDRDGDANLDAADWQAIGDFDADAWLFDRGADGKVELIVAFGQDASGVRADLFDIPESADSVPFTLESGRLVLPNDLYPTLRVVAPDGWWTHDGQANYNLDMTVDGAIDAAFNMQGEFAEIFATDGIPDATVAIRDRNGDGHPEFDWRHLLIPDEVTRPNQRDFLTVNVDDDEAPIGPTFPWLYLGALTYGYLTSSPHETTQPPIQIDWDAGKLVAVGEFVTSRGNDNQWFVYSNNQIVPGDLSIPNFEAPFGWYDFAADQDGMPEGSIRVVYYPPKDPILLGGQLETPYELIRYSWDQDNDDNWDYKVGALGKYPVPEESVIHFPEFDLNLLPYDELPTWVTEQTWGPVFFVASEITPTLGEGIYVWDPNGNEWGGVDSYFAGWRGTLAREGLAGPEPPPIQQGFRGDYNFGLFDQPWLYVSPIDRELHLERASGGIWNIDGRREMRYLDLDGDGQFDGWQVWAGGRITAQLYQVPGGLLYSDASQTLFRSVEIPDPLLRTLPPTNHEEWQALKTQLEGIQAAGVPGDLHAIFTSFDGSSTVLAQGPIADFRHDGGTVRFALMADTEETARTLTAASGTPVGMGLQSVAWDGTQWMVTSASFAAPTIAVEVGSAQALGNIPVVVTLANPATLTIAGATIAVQAISPDGMTVLPLTNEEVAIPGGGQQTFNLSWTPPRAGEWRIAVDVVRTAVDARTGLPVALAEQSAAVDVRPAPVLLPETAARLVWPGSILSRGLLAAGLAIVIGLVSAAALRRERSVT